MKKVLFKIGTTLAVAAGVFGSVNAQAQALTLSASNATNSGSGYINWRDSLAASGPGCSGGYWSQTYLNTTGFKIGSFNLTHNSAGGAYDYWSGFTTGSNGNNGEYGLPCAAVPCYADNTHAGSQEWICNQWGVMAGKGNPPSGQKGDPYFIAYWDYFSDGMNPNARSLQISLDNNVLFRPLSIYICNHPWPYYGNIKGDGFARPLNQSGDYFKLIIHGVLANGTEAPNTVTVDLAKYDASKPNKVDQSPDWQPVSLTALGGGLKSIYFTMVSTDEYPGYGPNTAVYFNMDKLVVTTTGGTSQAKAVVSKVQDKASKAMEVTDYFPIASYAGGEVIVYDVKGKEVLRMTVKAGEKINLSNLSKGEYRIRHGHRSIPFKKVK